MSKRLGEIVSALVLICPTITLAHGGGLDALGCHHNRKAADMIRGRTPLPPSSADVYVDPHWQTRQRPGKPMRVVES